MSEWDAAIALSAILGLIVTIALHLHSARQDRKIHFSDMLERFANQLSEIRVREITMTDIPSAIRYQRDYINTLNRLAYLRKLNKINDEMMNYFNSSFIHAHTLLNWEKHLYSVNSTHEHLFFSYAKWWINEKNIPADGFDTLHPQLYQMYQKTQDGDTLVFDNGKYGFSPKNKIQSPKSNNQ